VEEDEHEAGDGGEEPRVEEPRSVGNVKKPIRNAEIVAGRRDVKK
jgi:hypothetical protein